MTHDPLCHLSRETGEFNLMADRCYYCKLIAKVRADTIDKARKAVKVLPHTADCKAWWDESHDCWHGDVIAVLDAVVGSPDLADVLAANSRTIRR